MFCVVMEGRKEEGKGREECDDWTMTLSVKDPGPEAERLEAPALGPPRTNMHKYTSLEATVNGSPIVEPVRPVRGHYSSSPRSLALSPCPTSSTMAAPFSDGIGIANLPNQVRQHEVL